MNYIKRIYLNLANDSLYRNSIYLMLSTAVMAFLGFFFWIINARLFTPEQVGIGTTLISVVTLISSFSLLGLGNGLIRYLPTSERKNKKINTAFTLVTLTSFVIGAVYLFFINQFSPSLIFVKKNNLFSFLFLLFIIFTTLFSLIDNVFIAYRSTVYVLIKNTIWSAVKITLPLLLIGLGAYGIFMSVGLATVIAFILSLGFLIWKFNFQLQPVIDNTVVKQIIKFSLGNFTAGFIGNLPAMLLPILITNSIGAKFSAYFYMDMMMANFLFIIPIATSQSLFAEGSYSQEEIKNHLRKAVTIISILLIPTILVICLTGNYILQVFGKQYSSEGFTLLRLLSISGVFMSVISIGNALLNIKHKVNSIILLSLINTASVFLISAYLVHLKLTGVGISWLAGQGITAAAYLYFIYKYYLRQNTY